MSYVVVAVVPGFMFYAAAVVRVGGMDILSQIKGTFIVHGQALNVILLHV